MLRLFINSQWLSSEFVWSIHFAKEVRMHHLIQSFQQPNEGGSIIIPILKKKETEAETLNTSNVALLQGVKPNFILSAFWPLSH